MGKVLTVKEKLIIRIKEDQDIINHIETLERSILIKDDIIANLRDKNSIIESGLRNVPSKEQAGILEHFDNTIGKGSLG